MKTFFRRIHLYLGLAAGIPILISCLTGAILAFEKDLEMAFHHDRYFVAKGPAQLSPDSMGKLAVQAFPKAKLSGIKVYGDPERSAELMLSEEKKEGQQTGKGQEKKVDGKGPAAKPEAGKGGPKGKGGFTVFMNPYTGAVLEKYNYRETFFFQVMALHRWLLGSKESIGEEIMNISAFIFLFILITGIILWWPKTRKIMVQRLNIKWGAGWKRMNHDLHIVLGFYASIFLFIMAFTSMGIAHEWFSKGLEQLTGTSLKQKDAPKSAAAAPAGTKAPLATALLAAQAAQPGAIFYNISLPKDSSDAVSIAALPVNAAHENATNAVYVDQFNGQVLGQLPFDERTTAGKLRSYFKPVHTGAIGGTPTKILACIVALLGASFPITGFIMWRNRTRKKAKAKPLAATAVA